MNTETLKIAICDDDAVCREQVLSAVSDYIRERNERELTVLEFSHAEDLLERAKKEGGFDVYLLDIVMPHMNGIQLGDELRSHGYDGKIIYLTSSEEYALDSYRVRALSYLMKPVKSSLLFPVLDDALRLLTVKNERGIMVKTKSACARVTFDSILYAELCRRALFFHLTNGEVIESTTVRCSFDEALSEAISDPRFVQIGTSAIANMYHISAIESEAIVFKSGERLHVGKRVARTVRSVWYDFWFSGEGER